MASSSAADPLVHVAFNSKGTHFVAATSTGIRVFSCSPLKHMFSKNGFDSPDGGFGSPGEVVSADMALSGPVVAVVFRESGAADSSGQGGHKIRYWSELYCQMMPNMSPSCRGAVRAVRHVGDHVLVAGEDRVALHEASRRAVRRTGEFDTGPNPLGVCALAQTGGGRAFVLACPRPARGEVQVRHGGRGRRVVDVHAHSSSLACVALSRDGRLLATASSKGTVLRVFGTTDGKKLQEAVVVAGGDMRQEKASTCTVVSRVAGSKRPGSGPAFAVRRWKPGFINYHWRYADWQTEVDAAGAEVRAVHVHGDKTVLVLDGRVEVYGPEEGGGVLHRVETGGGCNPLGVCAVSQCVDDDAPLAFACPGAEVGEVRVERWAGEFTPVSFPAHSSRLACLAMSCDGRLVATASVKGTIVRVFLATGGALLREFRRGKDRADIHCMAFSPDSMWLAVSSDKATVHVFKINVDLASLAPEDDDGLQATSPAQSAATSDNKGSYLSYLTGLVPGIPGYLKPSKAECSLAKFHLRQGVKYSVAFSHEPYTVLIVGMDGSFYRCQFDPVKAGEMKQLEYRDFMSIK
ncbi:hypothetical protein ACP70R_004941 [Stipagrostis hirtigluma subsp. patula]